MSELQAIGEALAASKRVVILSHANPDPDTVGSALGLSEILRGLGISTTVLVPSPRSSGIPNVAGWNTVTEDENTARAAVEAADFVIAVDNTSLSRFGNWEWVLPRAAERGVKTANIDHHIDNSHFADLNYVVEGAPTCSMLIYKLAELMDWHVNEIAANALFAGLRSDTGGFRYPFDDYPSIFEIAAKLAEAGADPDAIAQWQLALTPQELKLLGAAINNSILFDNGYCEVSITKQMMERCNVTPTEAYVVVGEMGRVTGVKVLAVLTESEPQKTRLSVRTQPPYSAPAIARRFGGGGHELAAGAAVPLPFTQARKRVGIAVRQEMAKIDGPHSTGLN
jgi:phosphoesterase RecJ-like protein